MSLPPKKNGQDPLRAITDHPVDQAWHDYARAMRLSVLAGRPKVAGSAAYAEAALAYFAGAAAVQELFLAALEDNLDDNPCALGQRGVTEPDYDAHGVPGTAVLEAVKAEIADWVVRIFDPEQQRRQRIWWSK